MLLGRKCGCMACEILKDGEVIALRTTFGRGSHRGSESFSSKDKTLAGNQTKSDLS
jgi:hypothetical protein